MNAPGGNEERITVRRVGRAVRRRARRLPATARRRLPFGDRFRLALEDPTAPLCSDTKVDSSTLLLAFGGMKGKLDIPPFEFFGLTGEMPIKRLFVRDLKQAWYHRGVRRHGSTIPAVAEHLERIIAHQQIERLVVVGTSAGGYAALIFGSLLGADRVLCWGPQTVLDLEALAQMDDHRWDDKIVPLISGRHLDQDWIDLRRALPAARIAPTRYELFYDDSYPLDRLHVERLGEVDGVQLRPVDGGKHEVAREMRKTGELERVLRGALGV
jgi:pimeloyl-ACP methyl ester carboxylesterase